MMDSFPTGSTQSWLIMTAVVFSPAIVLFLADAIGRLFCRGRGKEEGNHRDRVTPKPTLKHPGVHLFSIAVCAHDVGSF